MKNLFRPAVCGIILFLVNILYPQSPVDRIKSIAEDLLPKYVDPLVTGFGTALGSGLYHSAQAHKPLGFDLGLRVMVVTIPAEAKSFNDSVLVYYLGKNGALDSTKKSVKNIPTIFGKSEKKTIQLGPDSIAMPPELPPGLGISVLPLLLPQASIGLIQGSELLIRYIPFPFKGTNIRFFGLGLKQELNKIKGLERLPFNIALQGVYQKFQLGDFSSTTTSFNLHTSRSFIIFAPYAGIGWENTKMKFSYTFKYSIPRDPEPKEKSINLSLTGKNDFRLVIGAAFKFGLLILNGDYNFGRYKGVNFGTSISLR